MNGKKIQNPFQSSYVTKLKSWIKTELRTIYLTSDKKQYLNEYEALIHESALEENRKMNRRWEEMKTNIAELVCEVLKKKQWGIFFKNEPVQSLPVQDSTTLYKVNEVKEDELVCAIKETIEERVNEWQHQTSQNQTDSESLNGTNQTLSDTKE
tara:strand:- start:339 stop:800 length:462 start_codon:yes stop_codon:yes gene_type:complete